MTLDDWDISHLSRDAQAVIAMATVIALGNGGYAPELVTVQAAIGMRDADFEAAVQEAYEDASAWRTGEFPDGLNTLETRWLLPIVEISIGPTNRPKAADWAALRDEVFERVFPGVERYCLYCRAFDVPLVLDHAVPLARGGSNHPLNLWPVCAPCNNSKGAKTAVEFIHWRGGIG